MMDIVFVIDDALSPNVKRSHARPKARGCNKDVFPALAAAFR